MTTMTPPWLKQDQGMYSETHLHTASCGLHRLLRSKNALQPRRNGRDGTGRWQRRCSQVQRTRRLRTIAAVQA
jgi:hypothetical protein